jgi:hypothetical protein
MKKFDFVPQNLRKLNQTLLLLFASLFLSASMLSASSALEKAHTQSAGAQPQVQAQPADLQALEAENIQDLKTLNSAIGAPELQRNTGIALKNSTRPTATKILQGRIRHQVDNQADPSFGNASLALGISAIAALLLGVFLPLFILLWPICAVLAIVFGAIGFSRSKKGDKKAKVGLWLGIIALIVPVLVIVVAILLMQLWEAIESSTYWF